MDGDTRKDLEQTVPLKTEEDDLVKLTTYQKLKNLKGNITVEPSLAFFMMTSIVTLLAIQNLNLDKACRVNLKFTDSACTALKMRIRDNLTYEEEEVQKLTASVEGWKSVIHTAFPVILIMFIGAWSDKTGRRKICILMPIAGEFISNIFNIVNTYFFYEVSVELTAFFASIFPSLTGAWYTMFLGCYSYLVDITSKQTRTFRLGVLTLAMSMAFPIGIGLSGVILRYTGFYGVFGISAIIQFLNFWYIYFYIKDHRWLETIDKNKPEGCVGFIKDFFNFNSLKETLFIVFKRGPKNRRLKVCLILTVVWLTFGPVWGETSISYIFCRYQFNWNEVEYSVYSFYSLVLHVTGTMFAISVFSKKLKCDDSVLGITAVLSRIAGALVWTFARNGTEIYIAPVMELLNGTTLIALRSIASKIVSSQELGKVYSLFGLSETIVPLLFAPLYSKVYILTLNILPGAIFLITVAACIPSLLAFIWFYCQHKKDRRKATLAIAEES